MGLLSRKNKKEKFTKTGVSKKMMEEQDIEDNSDEVEEDVFDDIPDLGTSIDDEEIVETPQKKVKQKENTEDTVEDLTEQAKKLEEKIQAIKEKEKQRQEQEQQKQIELNPEQIKNYLVYHESRLQKIESEVYRLRSGM